MLHVFFIVGVCMICCVFVFSFVGMMVICCRTVLVCFKGLVFCGGIFALVLLFDCFVCLALAVWV